MDLRFRLAVGSMRSVRTILPTYSYPVYSRMIICDNTLPHPSMNLINTSRYTRTIDSSRCLCHSVTCTGKRGFRASVTVLGVPHATPLAPATLEVDGFQLFGGPRHMQHD